MSLKSAPSESCRVEMGTRHLDGIAQEEGDGIGNKSGEQGRGVLTGGAMGVGGEGG